MTDEQRRAVPSREIWPELPLEAWQDTYDTLQLWTQIVGKVRLAKAPMMNHWWQVPLYVTSRGLSTSPIPHESGRSFQVDFDFIDHRLLIVLDDGRTESLLLAPRPVADFYRELMDRLKRLGLEVRIWTMPVEIPEPIPFQHDREHAAYDARCAHQFWRALVEVDRVLKQFRSGFLGKASPVHFFWGSFDMAVTRFSGRLAPPLRARPIWPIMSRAKPIRTRSAVAASGRAKVSASRPSIPTPIRSRRVTPTHWFSLMARPIAKISTNSFSPMTLPARAPRLIRPCSNSWRAPTQPPRILGIGTVPPSSAERPRFSALTRH